MDETTTAAGPPKRRLRHRIPTSLRQHWKLAAVFVAFVTVMATVFGANRIHPYITGDATVIASEITENITGTLDLFDNTVGHELTIDITDAEYDEMISAYRDNGEKKWVNATITIDGTTITDAEVRLKGNSTLMGLRGDGAGPPGGMQSPEGMEMPQDGQLPEGFDPAAALGGMTAISEDDPTSLPLLISFDRNAEGRAYQGMTELSVRPGTPVLNEAMALSLTAETGQPSQRYAYTVYSIWDSATATRLVLEHPDESYANSLFDSDGYLYKADANSRFTYVGDDQANYTDQFKQLNAAGTGDVQPIINFLKWLDSAGDEEFDAHLGDWVDVDSFARYLATQNLLVNGDDMSGPGQNYYLWYDLDTEKISVISWDLNLAMNGDATTGPDQAVTMGGMGRGPGAGAGGAPSQAPGGQMPAAGAGGEMPGAGAGTDPARSPVGMGNSLKTRFLASDAFDASYQGAYWELYEEMYGSGRALELLDTVSASIPTSDGLTADALREKVESMRTWIDQRTTALAEARDR
ncbi:CotH kinase family protein [Rhodococcus koreensis]